MKGSRATRDKIELYPAQRRDATTSPARRAIWGFLTKMKVWERVKGIEPSQPAWKAGALPLSYTRLRQSISADTPAKQVESIMDDKRRKRQVRFLMPKKAD